MGKFSGKKLLMLGSNVLATDIIRYAQDNGAYVIATDYYPAERSASKRIADETIDISTLDVDKLVDFGRDRGINGVFSGVAENNLLSAMGVSKRLGLRFYFNREQWNMIERKNEFRKLCEKFGVPCPATIYTGNGSDALDSLVAKELSFPIVVKPVDCAASLGVSICKNWDETVEAVKMASEVSDSGQIIIEEYVEGNEFTAHFTICKGKAAFTCMDNRYPVAVNTGNVTTIPAARIYPSTYTREFLDKVNKPMIFLCEGIGLENAVIFIQGMYDGEKGRFSIFEAGLRTAAESPCRILQHVTGQSYMNMLVDYILLGDTDYDLSREDPYLSSKCGGIVSFVTKGGVVGSIQGLEDSIEHTPSVLFHESRYPVGTETPHGNTLRQLMIRFGMLCESREQMARDVEYLNKNITVLDNQGNDMVIKLEPSRILNEFTSGGGITPLSNYWFFRVATFEKRVAA